MPLPVPPETMMFLRAFTLRQRKRAIRSSKLPKPSSRAMVMRSLGNLRIVMQVPRIASGRMMALTREPSLRRASTSGLDSSMRRPSGVTMRSTTARTRASSVKRCGTRTQRPPRSTNTVSGSMTMISVTAGSASSSSSGPRPSASSASSPTRRSVSVPAGKRCAMPLTMRRKLCSTRGRSDTSSIPSKPPEPKSRCSSSKRCASRRTSTPTSKLSTGTTPEIGSLSAGSALGATFWSAFAGALDGSTAITVCPSRI